MAFDYSSNRRPGSKAWLLAIAVALAASVATILVVAIPAADAQESLQVEVTGPDEIHHGGLIKIKITGITATTRLSMSLCATPDAKKCRLVLTEAGRKEGTASSNLAAYRFLRNGRSFVDCAADTSQCQVQVEDGTTIARTPVRFSNLRPVPQLTLGSQAIVPGESVEVSVNKFFGTDQPRNGSVVLQCPGNPRKVPESQCLSFTLIKPNKPATVAPSRMMTLGKRVVDCAAASSPCHLVVRDTYHGVRLRFAPSGEAEQSKVRISDTTNLTNHRKVAINIDTPLAGSASVFQCVQRTSARPVCNKLRGGWSAGDPAGDHAVARISTRPRRILFSDKGDVDCVDDGAECFLRVLINRHVIEKRIPISFDANEQIVRPELIVPEGPYVDGQQIRVELRGMAKGMHARFSCQARGNNDRQFCADATRAGADGASGAIVAMVTLRKADVCTGPTSRCYLIVSTNPGTKKFVVPVQFE